jgi:hypothetical protein
MNEMYYCIHMYHGISNYFQFLTDVKAASDKVASEKAAATKKAEETATAAKKVEAEKALCIISGKS